jgi:glycosyltransferase involved in cell wall biosynthesis
VTHDSVLVSAIMPTCNRRDYVPRAIDYFLRQDHPAKELVVVDDGEDRIRDIVPADERVRYHHSQATLGIGAKRNLACELARGSVIVHWDDDDWASPERIRRQLSALLDTGSDVTGARSVLFFHADSPFWWRYERPKTAKPWVCGATLCYTRDFWRKNPFPNLVFGEDDQFLISARRGRLDVREDEGLYVGLMHSRNTVRKRTLGPGWSRLQLGRAVDVLGEDGRFYDALRASVRRPSERFERIRSRRSRLAGRQWRRGEAGGPS